ncbi:hypothetical protein MMC27_001236 [Xylographa pallens]|nr:hypothetical protein [Xylographa pallens]
MEEPSLALSPSPIESAEMQDLVKVNKVLRHTIINIAKLVRDVSNVEEQAPAIDSIEETNGEVERNRLALSNPFSPQNDSKIKRRR